MRSLMTAVAALTMALTSISVAATQEQAKDQPIAGVWHATIETPHGKMAIEFDFKFDAKEKKNVSGSVTSAAIGRFPLTGEYTKGKLTFDVTGGPGEMTFVGTLKDRDTLVGVLSAHNGDMECVATRVKGS